MIAKRLVMLLFLTAMVMTALCALSPIGSLNATTYTCGNEFAQGSGCGDGTCPVGQTCTPVKVGSPPVDCTSQGKIGYICLGDSSSSSTTTVQLSTTTTHSSQIRATITPATQTVDVGQAVTMSVSISGGVPPYTVAWYNSSADPYCHGTGPTVQFGTGDSITLTQGQPGYPLVDTQYCAWVTDSDGNTARSSFATVNVNPPLVAGTPTPGVATIDDGQSITLSANPSGGSSGFYTNFVWFGVPYGGFGNQPCEDDHPPILLSSCNGNPTCTVAPTTGTYYCYSVTDSLGDSVTTSSADAANIDVNPSLIAAPISSSAGGVLTQGQSTTLSESPSQGTPPYTYQWYAGASANCASDPAVTCAAGPTCSSYTVTPFSTTDYCVTVTDSAFAPASATAGPYVVTVNVPAPATANYCGYSSSGGAAGYVNANNWIGINTLIILVTVMVAAFIWSVSGIFPANTREKLKGASRYEIIQVFVSILIIVLLILFASSMCLVGSQMAHDLNTSIYASSVYQGPYGFAENYVENLLFNKGVGLTTTMYATATSVVIEGDIYEGLLATYNELFVKDIEPTSFKALPITISYSSSFTLDMLYLSYASIYTDVYAVTAVITFGGLFVIWLALFVIYSISLTVLVPVAIVMRSFGFLGPKLREAADSLLGLAIGFYFILPLMIASNANTVSWMYSNAGTWIGADQLNQISTSSFFQSGTINTGIGFPVTSGLGSLTSGNVGYSILFSQPEVATTLGIEVAQYLFQGVVLIALDFAVTLGFAIGLAKGLGAIEGLISGGPVWGGGGGG